MVDQKVVVYWHFISQKVFFFFSIKIYQEKEYNNDFLYITFQISKITINIFLAHPVCFKTLNVVWNFLWKCNKTYVLKFATNTYSSM